MFLRNGGTCLPATNCHTSRSHNSTFYKALEVHLPRLSFTDCDLQNFGTLHYDTRAVSTVNRV